MKRLDSFSSRRESVVVRGPRVVRDAETGDIITLVERQADGITGARRPRCLVISTERGFTRLWNYPENWIDMSDAELKTLSELRRAQSA